MLSPSGCRAQSGWRCRRRRCRSPGSVSQENLRHEHARFDDSWLVNLLGDALGPPGRDIDMADGFDQFAIGKHPHYWVAAHLGVAAAGDCVVKTRRVRCWHGRATWISVVPPPMDADARPLPDLPELLAAVEEVERLYPLTPPLVFWRAYERAIYARLIPRLPGPVLDVGCGDGAFFSLLWPDCREVDGIDCDPTAVARARASGRYQTVWEGFAHDGPLPADRYGAAVSNCALEHMDEIDAVLRRIRGSLRPGGVFAATVVTDRFVAWNSMPGIFTHLDDGGRTAAHIQSAYEDYHHLRNAFPVGDWVERFRAAGFTVERAVPFLGEFSSRLFLFLDNLWHLGSDRGAPRGPLVEGYLAGFPDFGVALRRLVEGAYLAERDRTAGSGLFLLARRAA